MPSFEEILNMPASEIKAPQAFPVGTYHCIVDGVPEAGKSSQKGTDYLRFKFKILSAQPDVNAAEALEAQVQNKFIYSDYYIVDTAVWRLTELLEILGISVGEKESRSIKEMLAEVPGKQLLVKLKHELSPDGKRKYHRVDSTAAV
jgi:hypothetical protein